MTTSSKYAVQRDKIADTQPIKDANLKALHAAKLAGKVDGYEADRGDTWAVRRPGAPAIFFYTRTDRMKLSGQKKSTKIDVKGFLAWFQQNGRVE